MARALLVLGALAGAVLALTLYARASSQRELAPLPQIDWEGW